MLQHTDYMVSPYVPMPVCDKALSATQLAKPAKLAMHLELACMHVNHCFGHNCVLSEHQSFRRSCKGVVQCLHIFVKCHTCCQGCLRLSWVTVHDPVSHSCATCFWEFTCRDRHKDSGSCRNIMIFMLLSGTKTAPAVCIRAQLA